MCIPYLPFSCSMPLMLIFSYQFSLFETKARRHKVAAGFPPAPDLLRRMLSSHQPKSICASSEMTFMYERDTVLQSRLIKNSSREAFMELDPVED